MDPATYLQDLMSARLAAAERELTLAGEVPARVLGFAHPETEARLTEPADDVKDADPDALRVVLEWRGIDCLVWVRTGHELRSNGERGDVIVVASAVWRRHRLCTHRMLMPNLEPGRLVQVDATGLRIDVAWLEDLAPGG
ncbi:hypothetical protein [Phytomonospora endophytica]|nr:hypothetical protein [Phytomonospora endophytica]GIG66882.1 hypothetical protein Pen01_31770 [Phytomonospora endophytica]